MNSPTGLLKIAVCLLSSWPALAGAYCSSYFSTVNLKYSLHSFIAFTVNLHKLPAHECARQFESHFLDEKLGQEKAQSDLAAS